MQRLLDDPSAILAFYKEQSSFHNNYIIGILQAAQ